MPHPSPVVPGPGQESVWDYPRPPAVETVDRQVRVEVDGVVLADASRVVRVLETSHPPTYYVPVDDVRTDAIVPAEGASWCEWKGPAAYCSIITPRRIERAAWWYPEPTEPFAAVADHLAFYPALVDCFVDGEPVAPQPGAFYGGWVTPDVVGPFKGGPGSQFW